MAVNATPPSPSPSSYFRPCPQVGSHAPVPYTFSISKYDCPSNCSSHGACVGGECQCDDGYGGRDCSLASRALEYGARVEQAPAPFELAYFLLPEPSGGWGGRCGFWGHAHQRVGWWRGRKGRGSALEPLTAAAAASPAALPACREHADRQRRAGVRGEFGGRKGGVEMAGRELGHAGRAGRRGEGAVVTAGTTASLPMGGHHAP